MDERFEIARVRCYAGGRGEEEPRKFGHGSRELEVVEILDRWVDPTCRYFKVRAQDDGIYVLRHDLDFGTWAVMVYLEGL